ncbi:hypothetical protein GC167_02365 [bacterium]|nr:hypothetical protein [bacterium]
MRRIDWNWGLPLAMFLGNQWFQKQPYAPAFFRSYFDDLWVIPLCLGLLDALGDRFQRPLNPRQRWLYAGVGVLWFGWFFEHRLPPVHSGFTADVLDALAYALGGGLYALLASKLNPKSAKS